MVLCAGFGTRLRPLTDELPKPLVPVGDRPLLAHILIRLARTGVQHAVVNVYHKDEAFLGTFNGLPLVPQVIHESELLGTAGGIAGARGLLGDGPCVLHNGDIWIDPPVRSLLAAVEDGMCLAVRERPVGTGSVGLGEGGRVVRLRGSAFGVELAGADYVGVSALGQRCLGTLPERGCLIRDWAIPELSRGGEIRTVRTQASWVDVGGLAGYLASNLAWLGDRPDYVGPEATLSAGVELRRSVVGAGAEIVGEGLVEDCVIWPGARAVAPLRRAVVTGLGRVVLMDDP